MTEQFVYPGKELTIFSSAKNWKQYLASFIKPHIKGSVLEVGAGLGIMTSLTNLNPSEKWILLEPDTVMAGILEQKIKEGLLPKNCAVVHGTTGNVNTLSFDTIIYIDVLEHIEDDKSEIIKAANLLNPGGKLIILSPAFQFLFSPFDESIGHFRRYSKKSIRKIIVKNLKEESLSYLDSIGFFSSMANRLLLRQKYPTQQQILFWDQYLIPISLLFDKLFFYSFGKSILGIWLKELPENTSAQNRLQPNS